MILPLLSIVPWLFFTTSAAGLKHESGRCMMRGQCGKETFFGPELPCPYNGPAEEPDEDLRSSLASICGERYASGAVCCDAKQVADLRDNLKKAENLISSCPACKTNFYDFFCTFTCSPDQSLFLNIEETAKSRTGDQVVTHLSNYVSEEFGAGFFNSCKDVKFSATNGYVMDLIGGGAKDYKSFLRFLGHKSLLGSPIQIDFPDDVPAEFVPVPDVPKSCNDADPSMRCACVDCPAACPALADVGNAMNSCHIGVMPCLSFYILIVYAVGLLGMMIGYLYNVHRMARLRRNPSRLQLGSRDGTLSDDEDDAAIEWQEHPPPKQFRLNTSLQNIFYRIGFNCARYPYATIGSSILIIGILSIGWIRFSIETDPVRLWVAPTSAAAQEKQFFDETFGPFYRTQQIFLVNDTAPDSTVMTYENLQWWSDLEKDIYKIEVNGITLQDVCLKPVNDACVIQSVTGYFADVPLQENSWEQQLVSCTEQPVTCLPTFQQPLKPNTILGGYEDGVLRSKVLVASIVVKNSLDSEITSRAMQWENALKDYLVKAASEAASRGLRLSFNTEVSLEQELNKSTNTDANIVLLSYVVMFFYASIALGGSTFRGKRTLVESKFSLGLFGILIVLLSISASIGLFSLFGVKVTLIIAEVIPFLVLAVGVDNIFLLSHDFGRVNLRYNDKSIEERVAITLSHLGPSIMLSALSETVAFALGAFVGMPAVRNFAIYAAGSVFFDAVLQLTMFPAAMAIDQLRMESSRVDCVPFIRVNSDNAPNVDDEGHITRTIRRSLAPYLLRPYVKAAVMFVFISLTALALALFPEVQLGLDQKIALPRDSYLISYFQDLEHYFDTGPPVYFVVRGSDASFRETQQALCGRFTTCQEFSMANILEQERKRPEVSYLLEPAASWLDDFFYWLNPNLDSCCRIKKADRETFCSLDTPDRQCEPCFENRELPWNISMDGMPEGREFFAYAQAWLSAPTTEDCPIAGQAPYSDAVILDEEKEVVTASNARSFHTPLRTQADFINSYAAARRISHEISDSTGLQVFPYAVHYIFFDQYASIVQLSFSLVGSALFAVLLIATFLLGSLTAALLVVVTVAMIVIDIVGIMALWGISLNALSLVNLVICVGIGVEFCSHFARSYMLPSAESFSRGSLLGNDRDQRVWQALVSVGSSVFSGITMCKFVGVVVLAFTRSKIFEVYYFRMWLSLVFVAATHGLIFLPVLFSLLGPKGYASFEEEFEDNEWANNAESRYTSDLISHREDDDTDSNGLL